MNMERQGDNLVVTAGSPQKCEDPSRLKRLPMKLHVNYGHAPAPQLKKMVSRIPNI